MTAASRIRMFNLWADWSRVWAACRMEADDVRSSSNSFTVVAWVNFLTVSITSSALAELRPVIHISDGLCFARERADCRLRLFVSHVM